MKIFLVGGKSGSGKGEVAKLIKEFYIYKLEESVITEFSKYLKLYATELTEWDGNPATKPREYLQNIGDLVRSMDSNFLISRMIEDIEVYKNYVQNVIISDVRFPKEIDEMALNYDNVYCVGHKYSFWHSILTQDKFNVNKNLLNLKLYFLCQNKIGECDFTDFIGLFLVC